MKTLKILTLLFIMSFTACQGSDDYLANEKSVAYENAKEIPEISDETAVAKKMIKTGKISFETNDVLATKKRIDSLVRLYKAYISKEQNYHQNNSVINSTTVRIPNAHYDNFIKDITQNVTVNNISIKLNDVTDQFVDISARLKTKKQFEKRYLELLHKTNKVDEILAIEKQLETLQVDIEAVEGRLKLLNNQVSYATLDINYYTASDKTGSSKGFINGLVTGWQNFVSFLSALISVWPFLILFVLIFYYRKRIIKFRK